MLRYLDLGLLAYKIWTSIRRTEKWKVAGNLTPVLFVVIESGAIYSATIIAALVTFVLQNAAVYVILDMVRTTLTIITL